MTRVLHTGDTHLGYRQYHSPERQRDFLTAFQQVIDDAIDDDVAAVVHAGDLFHDRRPRLQDIMGALSVLRRLEDAAIPFLAIVGNHEGKRDAQWLDLFESLGLATRLDESPTVIEDTAFYGLDFVARARRDDLEYDFEPTDAKHTALVSHGLFQPFDHGDWDAREILEASPIEFDAMLLGDDHTPAKREVDGTWLTYCGSTERASASEREARGYNLVTFDDEVAIRRRSIDTRDFVFVDVELADGEGTERVREQVGQYDLDDAVVIVTVDGAGDRVPPATIEEFATDRGALIARVTDHRDIESESAFEVNFADPDEAVRARIEELGLSPAAQELDETVRASKIADSNVDDAVETRVRDLIEDGDEETFEPAPPAEGDSDAGSAVDAESDDEATDDIEDTNRTEAGDANDGESKTAESAVGEASTTAGSRKQDNDNETEAKPDSTEEVKERASSPTNQDDDPSGSDETTTEPESGSRSTETDDGDGQATMEEYL